MSLPCCHHSLNTRKFFQLQHNADGSGPRALVCSSVFIGLFAGLEDGTEAAFHTHGGEGIIRSACFRTFSPHGQNVDPIFFAHPGETCSPHVRNISHISASQPSGHLLAWVWRALHWVGLASCTQNLTQYCNHPIIKQRGPPRWGHDP